MISWYSSPLRLHDAREKVGCSSTPTLAHAAHRQPGGQRGAGCSHHFHGAGPSFEQRRKGFLMSEEGLWRGGQGAHPVARSSALLTGERSEPRLSWPPHSSATKVNARPSQRCEGCTSTNRTVASPLSAKSPVNFRIAMGKMREARGVPSRAGGQGASRGGIFVECPSSSRRTSSA